MRGVQAIESAPHVRRPRNGRVISLFFSFLSGGGSQNALPLRSESLPPVRWWSDSGPHRARSPHARQFDGQQAPARQHGGKRTFGLRAPDLVDDVPATHVMREASLAGQVVWRVNADPCKHVVGRYVRGGRIRIKCGNDGSFIGD